MDEYEAVLLVKPEVFIYKIPPRTTNRGYRASDWKLETPDWTGKMQVVAKGKNCIIKLLDKNTGELFAQAPIDKYPGIALEPVMDSSRYFILRIEDDNGRSAFIGIGFADRGDSFDMNVALQDHFKWLEKSEELEQADTPGRPALDLGFKDGQTITINMNIAKKSGSSARSRSKPSSSGSTPGLLPPPPSGLKIPPPSAKATSSSLSMQSSSSEESHPKGQSGQNELLLECGASSSSVAKSGPSQQALPPSSSQASAGPDLWSDFSSADVNSMSDPTDQSSSANNWIGF